MKNHIKHSWWLKDFEKKFGRNSELNKFLTAKYGTHIHYEPVMKSIKSFIKEVAQSSYNLGQLQPDKQQKSNTYLHLDGSIVCKKCEKTKSEGCSHYLK